jgi:hypothetical protein
MHNQHATRWSDALCIGRGGIALSFYIYAQNRFPLLRTML